MRTKRIRGGTVVLFEKIVKCSTYFNRLLQFTFLTLVMDYTICFTLEVCNFCFFVCNYSHTICSSLLSQKLLVTHSYACIYGPPFGIGLGPHIDTLSSDNEFVCRYEDNLRRDKIGWGCIFRSLPP